MPRKSFAETLSKSQLLVKALKERGENLPIGVTTNTCEVLEQLNNKAFEVNAQQEKLKAQLKEKTAEAEKNLSEIEAQYGIVKKYIKIALPQESWREFGFEDKR